jgi:hypothetical protein
MKKAPRSEQFGNKARPTSVDAADEEREDPLNPTFPRAPLLPHDLHRMANAALPKWSNPPNDKSGDRQLLTSQADFELFREHVDADPPPGTTPSTYDSATRAPHASIPHPSPLNQANSEIARKREVPAPAPPGRGARSGGGGAAPVVASPEATLGRSAGSWGARWLIVLAVVIVTAGGLWWLLF